ncbi:MAG: class I tRNA ligase family protein, partial [Crocinitomicaceae bacterium]
MEYNFRKIESDWRAKWAKDKSFKADDNSSKPKYYVLDMFPYPSGAGLHVGHPLGYIASDIFARYKRHSGFNVLHPMGYDSFGLPAEQYAIQTGQHPAITTKENIARYRDQLDKIGFSFDWDREVRTSDPKYYKWTQWIFKQLFDCWYNNTSNKAERIETLVQLFEKEGNANVNACSDCEITFSSEDWKNFDAAKKNEILMNYRLTYLAYSWVNWCPALGTVLANDEVVNGVSERGGHPVEQKRMRQWSMRIKAYAERLISGLDTLDWTDSIKDIQRNWIGKSVGCSLHFQLDGHDEQIEVFTTRPDTIFGVSFMTLAPEHPLVNKITTEAHKNAVESYQKSASLKTERDRQSDVKNITGEFTGAYVLHPFSGEKIPVWIGDYVLASYGTGAVMAVPCGDQRDWEFATHFNIPIKNIFKDQDIFKEAHTEKEGIICDSDFLDGLDVKVAMKKAIAEIESRNLGKGKINYRLRDAVFSRQRFWGEPFPVYYKNDIPHMVEDAKLPVELPKVDKYLPTEDGEPPLARAKKEDWNVFEGDRMEFNTMPGWAGSSWYFLRYMDPTNENEFVSKEKADYWQNVDLYVGGAEHGTGHLLYARFWTKFLHDLGYISFDEPFKKMINQGMILGRSSIGNKLMINLFPEKNDFGIYDVSDLYNCIVSQTIVDKIDLNNLDRNIIAYLKSSIDSILFSKNFNTEKIIVEYLADGKIKIKENGIDILKLNFSVSFIPQKIDINVVDNDILDIQRYKNLNTTDSDIDFVFDEDSKTLYCGHEIEKMSKSYYNVQTPDELVEKYGADTLRMYEMFLGPIEQAKPWDTKGISGVHNFLRKLWRLFYNDAGEKLFTEGEPDAKALKTL